MLPTSYDPGEQNYFLRDERDGYKMLFVSKAIMNGPRPFTPFWVGTCADHNSLTGLARWVQMRRDQWDYWAQLATEEGAGALARHIDRLVREQPLESVTATIVQKTEDPLEVAFGEMLHGVRGTRTEIVAKHSFRTLEAVDRFFDWFYSGSNCHLAEGLLNIAYAEGTDALGEALDEIADAPPMSRQARRQAARRQKQHA